MSYNSCSCTQDDMSPLLLSLFNGFRGRVVVGEDLARIVQWHAGDIESE